jgi:adenosylhomocysteine nucleosidase
MEAATIARLAQMRGIPVCCFKAVSDGPNAKLPDLNSFIDEQGQMRMIPFVLHAALRPTLWRPLMSLGKNSSAAADAIAVKVNRFLIEKDIVRTNRTGAV